MSIPKVSFLVALAGAVVVGVARAEPIGEVDTVFKLIGPDHKIVVDVYDDPKVPGVACYVSRAKTGGIKGGLGLAEDLAEASIACR
ncbi:MAG TPA: CreA family protein, partial [Polyangiales bacterium]|nr:CreA family protein [Polyangiales bacterium]